MGESPFIISQAARAELAESEALVGISSARNLVRCQMAFVSVTPLEAHRRKVADHDLPERDFAGMRPPALRQPGYVSVRFSGREPGHAYLIGETGFAAYLAMP